MRMSTRFSEFGVYSRSTTPSNFRKAAITFKASFFAPPPGSSKRAAAEASNEKDKAMIHELIKKMEGGFDGLNKFVRETIWHALKASHQNFETTFRGLEHDLTSAGSQVPGPGPTLLTRQSRQSPQPEGEKDSD
mmetsp:Transcript_28078/g.57969  ORF Transcript_28078/g.57969 Transcript_28078/m.57969 type:complete len:134 (+) Transcript_28078:607-1008(+)